MTEINHIMLPEKTKKVDIEKLVIWALRKNNNVYKDVNVGDTLVIDMTFDFVPEQETPISYNDIIGEFDTEPELDDKIPSGRIMFRSPNNTMLFKHWVEENQIKKFTLQSFTSANVGISKEQAVKIISHQIHKKTIVQTDTDTFKIVKEL